MSGIAGQFFRPFGFTVTVAVLFSLLVARTLTPMMAAYMLKPHEERPSKRRAIVMPWYLGRVRWCLEHRWKTLGAASLIIAACWRCSRCCRRRSRRPATTGLRA